jgi:16S rRNA (cytosine967-C5)-methyltransferase
VLDAPCSGTGTLRRRPDRRTRVTLEQIHHAARLQTQLLDAAVSLIAPGGALVYAVCSLEPEEGIEQIQRLLTHHRRLQLVEPQRWLGDAAAGVVAGDPPVLLTWPDSPSSEGFVAARMRLI